MAKDKLKFGRKDGNNADSSGESGHPLVTSGDGRVAIEMSGMANNLDQFFNQVTELKKLISDLKSDVSRVTSLHSKILSTPVPDERTKSQLDSLMTTIKTRSQVIRVKLKDMKKSINGMEEDSTSASVRIRSTQHSALLQNFIEVINEYHFAETEYRDRCKGRIKRQLEISGTIFSDDDVEKMLVEGNWSVFTRGIIRDSKEATQILEDVEARHNDIIKLEKSLVELHDLLLEMALLMENMGEKVDKIETRVDETRNHHVPNAIKQLEKAGRLQAKARKKKIIIIVVLILLVLLLGLVIGLNF